VKPVIAIDGPAGSGKSTVAKLVADRLQWSFLDTGAMYRAVTAEALRLGFSLSRDQDAVGEMADSCTITTLPRVTINDRDVTEEIRTQAVNEGVSLVAQMPHVRDAMVLRQRKFAQEQARGTVVEGRDITTVVFPAATLKIYLTASLAERARRRGDEGAESVERRDLVDSTRTLSPLTVAQDATVVDTTGLSPGEVVEEIVRCLQIATSSSTLEKP
jgi:cytidylate kinase